MRFFDPITSKCDWKTMRSVLRVVRVKEEMDRIFSPMPKYRLDDPHVVLLCA
jgi:hypothetical protein